MFKFFRTIRRGLLAESRFSKYFLYAIGEIILVVIGILIALEINNWNEERKLRKQEEVLLMDLRKNDEFINMLHRMLSVRSIGVTRTQSTISSIDSVIGLSMIN